MLSSPALVNVNGGPQGYTTTLTTDYGGSPARPEWNGFHLLDSEPGPGGPTLFLRGRYADRCAHGNRNLHAHLYPDGDRHLHGYLHRHRDIHIHPDLYGDLDLDRNPDFHGHFHIFYVSKNAFDPGRGPVSICVAYSNYPGDYSLRIYNSAGEHVKTLASEELTAPLEAS